MNEAIRIAIEKGGYEMPERNSGDRYGSGSEDDISKALLDPLFWQALGKARGWSIRENDRRGQEKGINEWLYHWHRFIDSLAAGEDVDLFFNDLLK